MECLLKISNIKSAVMQVYIYAYFVEDTLAQNQAFQTKRKMMWWHKHDRIKRSHKFCFEFVQLLCKIQCTQIYVKIWK